MRIELLPLKGKYYGTEVSVDGRHVKFWLTFSGHPKSYIPSDRELGEHGISRNQWDNNEQVEYVDSQGKVDKDYARDVVEACDHFEDQFSYEAALLFVKAMKEAYDDPTNN